MAAMKDIKGDFSRLEQLCKNKNQSACNFLWRFLDLDQSPTALDIEPGTESIRKPIPLANFVAIATDKLLSSVGSDSPQTGERFCRRLVEVPSAIICLYTQRDTMNKAFYRAAHFAEQQRVILQTSDILKNVSDMIWLGHDLRLNDFDAFWRALAKSGEPAIPEEETLHKDITAITQQESREDWSILAVQPSSIINGNLVHELLHAEYFANDKYRKIVASYVTTLQSTVDGQKLLQFVAERYHNQDPDLHANEVQAHLLDPFFQLSFIEETDPFGAELLAILSQEEALPRFLSSNPICVWHATVAEESRQQIAVPCAHLASLKQTLLWPCKQRGLWGYADGNGNFAIPPTFQRAGI